MLLVSPDTPSCQRTMVHCLVLRLEKKDVEYPVIFEKERFAMRDIASIEGEMDDDGGEHSQ